MNSLCFATEIAAAWLSMWMFWFAVIAFDCGRVLIAILLALAGIVSLCIAWIYSVAIR